MNRKPNKSLDSFSERILSFDTFGEAFSFKLGGGKQIHRTWLGAVFSIIVAIILAFYGSLQMQRLAIYGETVVTMSTRDSFFSPEQVFPHEIELLHSEFSVAFGFSAYDGNQERIDDPTIG